MNIVIINGSPRKNGATAQILREIESALIKKEECIVDFVNLSDLNISPCKGCCICYKSGSCFIDDDAEMLSNKIANADGVIIGSPTYASNISGQLKQFIDRGHFVIEQLLHKKYAISVATGENYGSSDTSKILVKLLKYSGARLSGKIICNLPFNSKAMTNSKLLAKISSSSNRIYKDIQTKKKYSFQAFVHNVIFRVGIKPFVIKKGESYNGVLSRWKQYRIVEND